MCCKEYFDHDSQTEVVELEDAKSAKLEKENGLETLNKFLLVSLKENNYPELIFQNLSEREREECFDLLDKMLHDITYDRLMEKAAELECENERLKDELESYEESVEHLSKCLRM